MLESARKLALIYLWENLNPNKDMPVSLSGWFIQERKDNPQRFFKFLIENPSKIEKVYVLTPAEDNADIVDMKELSLDSFGDQASEKLPFNMPSGSQSAALGPLIKRTFSKEKGAGPSTKILNTTVTSFRHLSEQSTSWASYFKIITEILNRNTLRFGDKLIESRANETALHTAVATINESKTVFLAVKDTQDRFPGEAPEYVQYLEYVLPLSKYASLNTPPKPKGNCPLCKSNNVTVYPSACSGAGINIANVDREGSFPSLTQDNAYLGYALCLNCADLLYTFKFYVLDTLLTTIAGSKAVLIPNLQETDQQLSKLRRLFKDYAQDIQKGSNHFVTKEKLIIQFLADSTAVVTIDIIWADFGQKLENIKGIITDVLPSRLRDIQQINHQFETDYDSPFKPNHWIEDIRFDLNVSAIYTLFKKPGGKSAKQANEAKAFFDFKRDLAECIYKKKPIHPNRFWDEFKATAIWYLNEAIKQESPHYYMTSEGHSEKKNKSWLTMAGWLRHFTVWISYLIKVEALKMAETRRTYQPEFEKLKPYFGADSGITSNEKAFAFLLGVLYGKLLRIQGARGVNVSANALTWLKKLNLSGKDLPEFYNKVRGKLLDYDAERNETVRKIIQELGIGFKLGNQINLDSVSCCYFLLLGQSVSEDIFKTEKEAANVRTA